MKINNPSMARCHLFAIQSTGTLRRAPGTRCSPTALTWACSPSSPDADGGALIGGHITSPSDGTGALQHRQQHRDLQPPRAPHARAGRARRHRADRAGRPASRLGGLHRAERLVVALGRRHRRQRLLRARSTGCAGPRSPAAETSALVTGLAANRSYQVAIQAPRQLRQPLGRVGPPLVVTTGPAPPRPAQPAASVRPVLPDRLTVSAPRHAHRASADRRRRLRPGSPRSLHGRRRAAACRPTGAQLVALNVTVTAPTRAGYLTVYPGGGARPPTSSLNFAAGQTVANMVVARVGAGGTVQLRGQRRHRPTCWSTSSAGSPRTR